MNRGLVLSLCAVVALGAMATASIAATDLSLNLRYTDPANPDEGGTWSLVGITDDADGLVGVSAYFSDVDTAGVTAGAGVNANINGGAIPVATFGSAINAVYGQDLSQAVTTGVGSGTMAIDDPLLNSDWDGASVLFTGTFSTGTRPSFTTSGANSTDANEYDAGNNVGVAAAPTTTVRGDSLNTLGLESPAGAGLNLGDSDRDGLVTLANDVFPALANIGAGAGFGWDDGDFDNDGLVTLANDIFPALAFVGGGASIPPAIGAVPEPSAVCLALLGLAGIGLAKRRRRN